MANTDRMKATPVSEKKENFQAKAYKVARGLDALVKGPPDLLKYGASIMQALEKAVESDTPSSAAQVMLGMALIEGTYNVLQEERGRELILAAAKRGNVEAQFIMAYCVLGGNEAMRDLQKMYVKYPDYQKKMRGLFDRAHNEFPEMECKESIPSIEWAMKVFLQPALAIQAEIQTLTQLIEHEANQKNPPAQLMLALLKWQGNFFTINQDAVFNLIREAAKNNNLVAQTIYYYLIDTVRRVLEVLPNKTALKNVSIEGTGAGIYEEVFAVELLNSPGLFKLAKEHRDGDKRVPAFSFLLSGSPPQRLPETKPVPVVEEKRPPVESSVQGFIKTARKHVAQQNYKEAWRFFNLAAKQFEPNAQLIVALVLLRLKTKFAVEALDGIDAETKATVAALLKNVEIQKKVQASFVNAEESIRYAENRLVHLSFTGHEVGRHVLDAFQRFQNSPPALVKQKEETKASEVKKIDPVLAKKQQEQEDNQNIINHFINEIECEIKSSTSEDALTVLKKMLVAAYKEGVEDKLNVDVLKHLPQAERNEEFWDLLCRGLLFGKGEPFFKLLRNTGVFAVLFPSLSPESTRDQERNLDCIADRLSLFDASLADAARPLFLDDGEVDKGRVFAMLVAKEAVHVTRDFSRRFFSPIKEIEVTSNVDIAFIQQQYGMLRGEKYSDLSSRVVAALDRRFAFFTKRAHEEHAMREAPRVFRRAL